MQSLTFQQSTPIQSGSMINRFQQKQEVTHEKVRDAVRAWAAANDNQDVVAGLIVAEWHASGGQGIDFPADLSRQRQKLFRWLDGETEYARSNVRQLMPAILAVLPLEFRARLLPPQADAMSRVAAAIKECAEAKQAVLLDAPKHQKLKEMSEGIVSMFRLEPDLAGPLMAMVTSMLGAM